MTPCRKAIFFRRCSKDKDACEVVSCSQGCGRSFHGCKESEHYELCPLTRIFCLNQEFGCQQEILRRDIVTHLPVCPANIVMCTQEWNRYSCGHFVYETFNYTSFNYWQLTTLLLWINLNWSLFADGLCTAESDGKQFHFVWGTLELCQVSVTNQILVLYHVTCYQPIRNKYYYCVRSVGLWVGCQRSENGGRVLQSS